MYAQSNKRINILLERLQNGQCSLVDYIVSDGHQTGVHAGTIQNVCFNKPLISWQVDLVGVDLVGS